MKRKGSRPKFRAGQVVMWIGGKRPLPVIVKTIHLWRSMETCYEVDPDPSERPNWLSTIPESQFRALTKQEASRATK